MLAAAGPRGHGNDNGGEDVEVEERRGNDGDEGSCRGLGKEEGGGDIEGR